MTGRALAAVPATAPRALGLVRVSKERDGMVSPEVQRTAIADYCAARGYHLVKIREGLDQSGSRARSAWWPTLDMAVADVEDGSYDVIVTWKYSRVARHRLRWAVAIDRVESAGGRVESATEQVDTTTSTGRFTRGMLAELQAFEAERIGEVWKEVHARRVATGRPPTGKPKYGYLYDREGKLHRPDPDTGPVLAEVYRRYIAGDSMYVLVRWLNAHGWRTLDEGLWSDRSLRRVLDSGFAAGRFMVHGELVDGVHEPLIDEQTWRAYRDARERRRAAPARRERSQYLLSGLVRCSRCGHPMVAGQFGHERAPKYRCKTGKEQGPEGCAGGYVMAAYVEAAVLERVEELAGDVEVRRAAAAAARTKATTLRADVRVVARQLQRAEEALGRLAVQHAEHPLPASVYAAAYDELAAQVEALRSDLEDLERGSRRAAVNPRQVAKGLLESWDQRPVAQRRELLSQLVDHVAVWTGRPRARLQVVMVFEEA